MPDLMFFARRRLGTSTNCADGRRRTLVLGCWIEGVPYEFPHLHPLHHCAVCAYLATRHLEQKGRRAG